MKSEALRAVLPGFAAVPGLDAVATAFRKAARAEGTGPAFTVCVSDDQGRLVAEEHLASYNQVKVFSREMAKLGFQASLAGTPRPGCDVVYSRQAAARDIFDDGGPHSTMSGV